MLYSRGELLYARVFISRPTARYMHHAYNTLVSFSVQIFIADGLLVCTAAHTTKAFLGQQYIRRAMRSPRGATKCLRRACVLAAGLRRHRASLSHYHIIIDPTSVPQPAAEASTTTQRARLAAVSSGSDRSVLSRLFVQEYHRARRVFAHSKIARTLR